MVEGYPNSPFEEYGKMWDISVEKWRDEPKVPHMYLSYIQTTPATKLKNYNRLIALDKAWVVVREDIIQSCDPILDKDALKVAWDDPDERCRTAAQERIGTYRHSWM